MNWPDSSEPARVYDGLVSCARTFSGDRVSRMRSAADAMWEALHTAGVSWIGFYEIAGEGNDHGAEPGAAMILGPHSDKPACSPIGLHGACGRAWSEKRTLIVTDVANLGEGYVACDPLDKSELVIPCLNEDGSCWGVLDADSFDAGCFNAGDAAGMFALLVTAGLTTGQEPASVVI